jgi:predicted transcriptional regulator
MSRDNSRSKHYHGKKKNEMVIHGSQSSVMRRSRRMMMSMYIVCVEADAVCHKRVKRMACSAYSEIPLLSTCYRDVKMLQMTRV